MIQARLARKESTLAGPPEGTKRRAQDRPCRRLLSPRAWDWTVGPHGNPLSCPDNGSALLQTSKQRYRPTHISSRREDSERLPAAGFKAAVAQRSRRLVVGWYIGVPHGTPTSTGRQDDFGSHPHPQREGRIFPAVQAAVGGASLGPLMVGRAGNRSARESSPRWSAPRRSAPARPPAGRRRWPGRPGPIG